LFLPTAIAGLWCDLAAGGAGRYLRNPLRCGRAFLCAVGGGRLGVPDPREHTFGPLSCMHLMPKRAPWAGHAHPLHLHICRDTAHSHGRVLRKAGLLTSKDEHRARLADCTPHFYAEGYGHSDGGICAACGRHCATHVARSRAAGLTAGCRRRLPRRPLALKGPALQGVPGVGAFAFCLCRDPLYGLENPLRLFTACRTSSVCISALRLR